MRALTFITVILTILATPSVAEEGTIPREGTMSLEGMHTILERLDDELQNQNGTWQLTIADVPVVVVTDAANNRMRIMIAIRKADTLTPEDLTRIMQANFDSALDARYAIAKGILWSTFIHPLSTLHDRQLIEAIGQTVNLARTYGSSYSSGLLLFGGGDSGAIQQRELIDELLKQGQPT